MTLKEINTVRKSLEDTVSTQEYTCKRVKKELDEIKVKFLDGTATDGDRTLADRAEDELAELLLSMETLRRAIRLIDESEVLLKV